MSAVRLLIGTKKAAFVYIDGSDPEGVYAGTSNGEVYASIDGGDHWERLPGTLPPVLSITCAVY